MVPARGACKPRGGLTVSHYAIALPVCGACGGSRGSQASTRPHIGGKGVRFMGVDMLGHYTGKREEEGEEGEGKFVCLFVCRFTDSRSVEVPPY